MATTRMTASNTFTKGLIMDFSPTVAKDNCMTNALNATLLTFNGNEMSLQQDMGNGRVETAYLPEGYVPVGSCEFGDIIYIVSYNPLENKSQIGCFPSPERNVSSDEITDLQQTLSASDFQELNGNAPTGVIKATTVKKIVYGNKNMNPGDKYIIYEEDSDNLKEDGVTLSDYANTSHEHDTWPKLLKLSVVSIEDSGKIVDLNASVKWYDNDYYLTSLDTTSTGTTPDLDSYRSLVSSAYSVFQSKVSGKLAILAELEAIDGFSCTYDVYTTNTTGDDGTTETSYSIYFYTSWTNSHNDINPSGFIFTQSAWTKDENGGKLYCPVTANGSTVTYEYGNAAIDTPVVVNGTDTGYNVSSVYEYSRTYKLEEPSNNFMEYLAEESFNAKISDIIDWMADGTGEYKAVNLEGSSYDNLRPVTKVTRILDENGEPMTDGKDTDGHTQYLYVYNLDSYERDDKGSITYLTKGNNGTMLALKEITLKDDVVNNYFHKDVPTLITDEFSLRRTTAVNITDSDNEQQTVILDNDLSKLVWNYTIAPVMPYGVLDYLAISGSIDFSKLGTGLIDLSTWRYYASGNVLTLTWGLDAYAEPNKGIAEVVFDFYDNQGLAASYHNTGKTSYSGTFTESIVLGQRNSSYKLNAVDAYGNSYIHAGVEDDSGTIYLDGNNKPTTSKTTSYGPYLDDAGTLYPSMLYLVRITVKYCPKDVLGDYDTDNSSGFKTYYRWLWTNGIFNDSYYNIQDFVVLQPQLSLDFSVTFNTKGAGGTNKLVASTNLYRSADEIVYSTSKDALYKTIGANVYSINQDGSDDSAGNILLTAEPVLYEGYDTFNLNEDALDVIASVTVSLGKSSITKSVDSPSFVYTGDSHTTGIEDNIQPVIATELCSHATDGWDRSGYANYSYGANNCRVSNTLLALLGTSLVSYKSTYDAAGTAVGGESTELYSSADAYEAYLDSFSLNMVGASLSTEKLSYTDSNGDTQTVDHYQNCTVTLEKIRNDGIKLVLAGIAFSKMFASEISKDSASKVLKSIIHDNSSDAEYNSPKAAGLHLYNNHMYFNEVVTWHMGESGGHDTRWGSYYSRGISDNTWFGSATDGEAHSSHDKWRPEYTNDEVQNLWKSHLTNTVAAFMICRSDSSNGKIDYTFSDVSWDTIKTKFGLTKNGNRIHNSRSVCPLQKPSDWKTDKDDWLIHSFMVYDQESGYVVPIADYFVGASYGKQYTSKSGIVTYSLGDMLGSLFAQLYVVDTSADGDSSILGNFVTLQDFEEYWNKDIIISVDTSDLEQDDINSLITIQTQTFTNYLTYLETNSGIDYDSIDKTNVTLVLYGMQRPVTFQFAVSYDVGDLIYIYDNLAESSNKIALSVLEDGAAVTESFQGNVTANTLYTWTGSTVTEFGANSVLYYASTFKDIDGEIHMVSSGTAMNTSSFATIAKILRYDGGELSWHNLSQFSSWNATYDIKYAGTGDDPYLKKLPNISFFKLYKPGS